MMVGRAVTAATLLAFVAAVGPVIPAQGRSATSLPLDSTYLGDCEIPVELRALSGGSAEADEDNVRGLDGMRILLPDVYGTTDPPPGPVRMPADFEPSDVLYLAYPGVPEYDGMFETVLDTAAPEGDVVILVEPEDAPALGAILDHLGLDAPYVQVVDDLPFDSVWMRDYGPHYVFDAKGLSIVDPRYFTNCLYDDAVPTELAAREPRSPVYRSPLRIEGGDLLSNGNGVCFTTFRTLDKNGLDGEDFADLAWSWFGCEEVVTLHPLVGDVVPHVDMFLLPAAEDLVLLGYYDPQQEPISHDILESNRAILESVRLADGRPLRIVRVPMPDPWLVPSAGEPVLHRSYLNLLVFNDAVMVPVYEGDPAREMAALRAIGDAFPGRRITSVGADEVSLDLGALHCIARTRPAGASRPPARTREEGKDGHGSRESTTKTR